MTFSNKGKANKVDRQTKYIYIYNIKSRCHLIIYRRELFFKAKLYFGLFKNLLWTVH